MSKRVYEALIIGFGGAFALAFAVIVIPALRESGDVIGAFAAGFVNPFSTGYSLDAIFCAMILISWMVYERSALGVRHGWIIAPLCFAPGVATAFAAYLLIRARFRPDQAG